MSEEPREDQEFIAKLKSMNAESDKRIVEQRELMAEGARLLAEERKLWAESSKLWSEERKLRFDPMIAGLTAGAALFAVGAVLGGVLVRFAACAQH